MNTFTTTARRWTTVGALAVASFALTTTTPAGAIPVHDRLGEPARTGFSMTSDSDTGTRPCFLQRPRWNEALDGPQPSC